MILYYMVKRLLKLWYTLLIRLFSSTGYVKKENWYINHKILCPLKQTTNCFYNLLFQSAIQLLAHLSGLATLTYYYVTALNEFQKDGDKKQKVFAKKREFSQWSQWETQAVQKSGGQVISLYVENPVIDDISYLDNTTQPIILLCRHMETARELLKSKHKDNLSLAFHYTTHWQSLIDSIPLNEQIGIWGHIPCQKVKNIYHPRLNFILPEHLSYPPFVDLLVKCS